MGRAEAHNGDQRGRCWLREISRDWPRYGYRFAHGLLRREAWKVNRKRVQRLWREEGLRVRPYAMKRHRVGMSTVPARRLRAERRNQVWALDFIFDSTSDGRPIKALAMCDEHTRESIGRQLGRSITADDVVDVLDQAKAERGAPECIRMDNGPELIASAIRDWCRLSGTGTIYIEPGSPWENPFVESFNARLRDELFNREIFHSVFEARVLYFDWCDVYNNFRPHSSLGYLAPAMFAALLLGKLPTPELATR
ncbi:MAG: IS3 family transposase [Candidatus Dormibacteraceae bacterium]